MVEVCEWSSLWLLIFRLRSCAGPHALACAAKTKGCVAALVVASVAPYDAEGLNWMAGQGQDSTPNMPWVSASWRTICLP